MIAAVRALRAASPVPGEGDAGEGDALEDDAALPSPRQGNTVWLHDEYDVTGKLLPNGASLAPFRCQIA